MEKISENLLYWTNKMKQTRNSLAELNEVQYKDFLFQNVLTLKLSSIMIFGVIPPHHRYFSVAQLYVLMLTVNVFFSHCSVIHSCETDNRPSISFFFLKFFKNS